MHVERRDDSLGFLRHYGLRDFFLVRNFGKRIGNFFYGFSRAELERNFEKLGEEKIERSIKGKLFTLDKIEVDSIFLTKSLLGSLSKTVVAFTGGKNRNNGFGLTMKY